MKSDAACNCNCRVSSWLDADCSYWKPVSSWKGPAMNENSFPLSMKKIENVFIISCQWILSKVSYQIDPHFFFFFFCEEKKAEKMYTISIHFNVRTQGDRRGCKRRKRGSISLHLFFFLRRFYFITSEYHTNCRLFNGWSRSFFLKAAQRNFRLYSFVGAEGGERFNE